MCNEYQQKWRTRRPAIETAAIETGGMLEPLPLGEDCMRLQSRLLLSHLCAAFDGLAGWLAVGAPELLSRIPQ